MGRRKIPMEMVKDSNTRQVTFSKRRNGVFKKADELSTLCGVDVAIMVFSPGGRPYSYGNPSVNAVVNRYLGPEASAGVTLNTGIPNSSRRAKKLAAVQQAKIEKSQAYLNSLEEKLEAEKQRGEALKEKLKETCEKNKIKDMKDLNLDELCEFKKKLEALRAMISGRVMEMEASSTLMMLSKDKTLIKPEGSKIETKEEEKKNKKKKKKKTIKK